MEPFDLKGRVAVVTGSTKGIGKAIAAGFCRAGARVVVSSRKADACEAVAAELNREQARDGGEAVSIPCHAGQLDQLEALVSRTLDRWGRIDACVPNAAANPYHGGLAGIPDSAFDKIMETNVRATFWLCRLVLPHMVERGGGSITIIASIAGLKGSPDLGAYAMSKVACHQLARNLAVEYGPHGVRVNAIAPGYVETDFNREFLRAEQGKRLVRGIPQRRAGRPEELDGALLLLASDASSFMTGSVITVDGGHACASV